MSQREFKGALYEQFARLGHAVSSPKRLEMLDLLSLQALGRSRLAEVDQTTNLYLQRRDQLQPVSLTELRRLVRSGGVTVIAYCRGPYCVYSVDAVGILRKHGYSARRAEDGLPGWRTEGLEVVASA